MKKSNKFDWYKARQRFSLRKFHFGAASVLLGTALFLGTSNTSVVQADEQSGSADADATQESEALPPTETNHVSVETEVQAPEVVEASTIALDTVKPAVVSEVQEVSAETVNADAPATPVVAETSPVAPATEVTTPAPASQSDVAEVSENTAVAPATDQVTAEDTPTPVAQSANESSETLSLDEAKPTLALATTEAPVQSEEISLSQTVFKPQNGVYATLAEGVAPEYQANAAKMRDSLFFPDWSKATNLDAKGDLQVGTQLVVTPAPGYEVTITVKELKPFNSTEEYKQRILDAGFALEDLNYDPDAVNTSFSKHEQGAALRPAVYGTGAYRNLRNFSGYDLGSEAKTRIYATRANGGVTFGLKATFNGREVPVQAFITDGESIDRPEVSIVKTNGDPFKLVDLSSTGESVYFHTGNPNRLVHNPRIIDETYFDNMTNTISNPITHGYRRPELLLNPNPNGGQGTKLISDINSGSLSHDGSAYEFHSVPILTTDNVTELSYYYVLGGDQAFIMGFVIPMDKSDAPDTYGKATHLLHITAAESDFKLGDQTGGEDLRVVPKTTGNPYLGREIASPDDMTKEVTTFWTEDDSTATYQGHGADEGEEQLTGSRYSSYKTGASRLRLDVLANRNGAASAHVSAWVDFNNNGSFDEDEKASAEVTEDGKLTLKFDTDYNSIPANADKLGVRVRIASNADDVANPTGAAQDGEVEDFQISVVEPTNTPSATPKETTDIQGQVQSGTPTFNTGDEDIDFARYQLISPVTGQPTTDLTLPATSKGVQVGSYSFNPANGLVTFTPNKDFVGTADPVTVRAIDPNGKFVDETYTPTVTEVKPTAKPDTSQDAQGLEQSGTVTFTAGDVRVPIDDSVDATFDNGSKEIIVPNTGKYTVAKDGTVTFTPEKTFIGQGPAVTVVRQDVNGTIAKGTYTPTVTPVIPFAEPSVSQGIQGKPQAGQPIFHPGHELVSMDDSVDATFDNGSKEIIVPKTGKFTVAKDGTVTFTPEKTFVGQAPAVTVVRQDVNGTVAKGTYTPTVIAVTPTGKDATSTGPQEQVQTGKPTFTPGHADVLMDDSVHATFDNGTKNLTIPNVGQFTVANDGTVTFTPEKTFVGQAPSVTVVRQDTNGTKATAKYTPTVTAVTPVIPTGKDVTSTGIQGKVQTGKPVFEAGNPSVPMDDNVDATFDDGSKTITVPKTGQFTVAKDGTVTFTPEKAFVGQAPAVTVVRQDTKGTKARAKYTPTVTAVVPKGKGQTSTGLQGQVQTGTPVFEAGHADVPLKADVTFEDGSKKILVSNEGTYELDATGKVTFTPEKTFTGIAKGVTLIRKDENDTVARAKYTPEVTPVTPTGKDATSRGPKNQAQTGTPEFTPGDAAVPLVPEVTFEDNSKEITVPGEGTYTVDATGTVTFTPAKDFVGTAKGVTVVRKDENGTPAKAKYVPTVVDDITGGNATSTGIQGKPQEGTPDFKGGTPVTPAEFEDGGTTKVVPGEGTYTVDPDGKVTFTPEKGFTGKGTGVTVIRKDKDGTPIKGTYTPEVTPVTPTGKDATSRGPKNQAQMGTPEFTPGDTAVPLVPDVTFEDGSTKVDVPNEGTYELDATGKVTFTPVKDFVGTAKGVTVVRKDENGTPAKAKYVPTVVDDIAGGDTTSTGIQGKPQEGTPDFKGGTPVTPAEFEGGGTTKVVPGEGTYTVDPDGKVTFTPEKGFTGKGTGVTVIRKDKDGTPIKGTYTPEVTPVTPTGKDATSRGPKNQAQMGTPEFTPGDAAVPLVPEVTFEDNSKEITVPGEGTYTVDATGTVTFTPAKDFVGTAKGVTVVRKDENGTPAKAKYVPTVVDDIAGGDTTSTGIQGKPQEGTPDFKGGTPVTPAEFEGGGTTKVVPGEGTYTVDPDGKVTFTPEKGFTGKGTGVTVIRKDKDGTPIKGTYTPEVTPVTPTGKDATSRGPKNQAQTGTPEFTPGDAAVPLVPEVTFEDNSKEITVPGEGTYTVDATGTVTFTPVKDFVGTAKGVTVVRKDENGTPAKAKYVPTVVDDIAGGDTTSTGIQGKPQEGTPDFKGGTPVTPAEFEGGGTTKVVPGEGTYTVDPDGKVTFTPEKGFTGKGTGVTVIRKDKDGTPIKGTYTPEVTPVTPTGKDATSRGPKNQAQMGTPEFTPGDTAVPLTPEVTFEDGSTKVDVPNEGTYELDATGKVTFTPAKDFVGTAKGVTVVRKDENGTPAKAKYVPTVVDDIAGGDTTSTGIQGKPQEGTPDFKGGIPVTPAEFEGGGTTKVVPGEGTYTVDPDGKVTFTPEKGFTGKGTGVTVIRKDKDGTPIKGTYTPEVTPVTPTGKDATSRGPKNQAQMGTPEFTPGDAAVPLVPEVTFEDNSKEITVPGEGTYTVDATGTVTFTPAKDFVGTAKGVTVVRKDENGTPAKAKYVPTVVDDIAGGDTTSTGIQGKPQEGTPDFKGGTPVTPAEFEGGGTTKVVPGEGTYTVDPDGKVTFTPEKGFTGKGTGVTVIRKDKDGTPIKGTYTPEVTPVTPTGKDATSRGPKNQAQTGTPEFTPGDAAVPLVPDVTFEDGSTKVDVPNEGTYELDATGKVTFTPVKDFVGTAKGVTVVRKDENGTPAKAKYVPTVVDDIAGGDTTSTGIQGKPQEGTPDFKGGTPVTPAEFEGGGTTKVVPGEGTYTVDPDGKVTFTPEKGFTGKGTGVTVIRKDKDGTPIKGTYTPEVTPVTPTGKDATSRGPKNQAQTGTPEFTPGDAAVPLVPDVTFEDGSTKVDVPNEGTYELDATGKVTFTPVKDFVGTAKGVTVVRKDENGTPAKAKYVPTVVDDIAGGDTTSTGIQGKPQEGTPDFKGGTPVTPAEFEGGGTTKVVPGEGTYTVDPDGKVTFTPEKGFTGKGTGVTVIRKDKDGTPIKGTYTPEVEKINPSGKATTSTGVQGATQTGKPGFTPGHADIPMDDKSPATFADGTTTQVVPDEGTYTVASDGTVTFTPELGFTGEARGVVVVRKDINGSPATAHYVPTVTPAKQSSEAAKSKDIQGKPQTGTPIFNSSAGFDDKVPATFDDGSTKKVVPGEGTYEVAPNGTVVFTPEPQFVGQAKGVKVHRRDKTGALVIGEYIPEVTKAETLATGDTSKGPKGAPQSGKPDFKSEVGLDDTTPATFDDGSKEKVVPGEGTYTVAPDGTVTFKPEPNFVGQAKGVTVVRKDKVGNTLTATYTPTVTDTQKVTPEVKPLPQPLNNTPGNNQSRGTAPSGNAPVANLPETGDESSLLLTLAGTAMAGLGLAGKRRKGNED